MLNDVFPLRVEAVPAARASEWRADDSFPPQQHAAVIAAFLNGAAAHIDQLPRLRLVRRKGVIGAPL